MHTLTVIEAGGRQHAVHFSPGRSVMQVAIDQQVPGILADCGGSCSCATCHCYIDEAWAATFPPPSPEELELVAYAFEALPASRLACQLLLRHDHDGLVVRLPSRQI